MVAKPAHSHDYLSNQQRAGKMKKIMHTFIYDEDGAVTVDWVVLTAAVVTLGIGLLVGISNATSNLEEVTSEAITSGDDSQLQ
jgi:Flp pilus assembly pilin Flp